MATQLSVAVRNAMAGALESTVGASPTLEIRTGAPPAATSNADSGTLLAALVLPADWLTNATNGVVSLNGSWTVPEAVGTGDAGHYRIKQGATCHGQGTASQRAESGGTGDLKLAQATAGIVAGQSVTVTAFTYTQGNA